MLSVGKLFAIAAIVALVLGFVRWPTFGTGFYAITIKNRVYGFGPDYWAFALTAGKRQQRRSPIFGRKD